MEILVSNTPITETKYLSIESNSFWKLTRIETIALSGDGAQIKIWNGNELIIDELLTNKLYEFDNLDINLPGIYVQVLGGSGRAMFWADSTLPEE